MLNYKDSSRCESSVAFILTNNIIYQSITVPENWYGNTLLILSHPQGEEISSVRIGDDTYPRRE